MDVVQTKITIQREDEEISKQYGIFMLKLQELLKEVRLNDIKLFLNSLHPTGKALTSEMKQARTISKFMLSFSKTQTWWDFWTSSTLARVFGRDRGLLLVEMYQEKLKNHLLHRITINFPAVLRSKEVVVKINDNYDNYTEEKVLQFRKTVSELLKLDQKDFVFFPAEKGCVKLTFLLPSRFADRLRDIELNQLKEHRVQSLSIDG